MERPRQLPLVEGPRSLKAWKVNPMPGLDICFLISTLYWKYYPAACNDTIIVIPSDCYDIVGLRDAYQGW